MVNYRKKKPLTFKDGGAVPFADVVEPVAEPLEAASIKIPADEAPAAAPEPDAVQQAYERTLRAQQFQPPPPPVQLPPKTIDEAIDRLPVSDFWKTSLRSHPEIMEHNNQTTVAFYHQRALKDGIDPESPEMVSHIMGGIQAEKARAVENAKRAALLMTPPPPDRAIREADAMPAPAPALMPAQRQPRMPVSAPVSRDVPSASGRRTSDNKTLTPQEVEIALKSFSASDMTDEQKVMSYWKNREKLRHMRETGEYRKTTEQTG